MDESRDSKNSIEGDLDFLKEINEKINKGTIKEISELTHVIGDWIDELETKLREITKPE